MSRVYEFVYIVRWLNNGEPRCAATSVLSTSKTRSRVVARENAARIIAWDLNSHTEPGERVPADYLTLQYTRDCETGEEKW